MKLFRCKLFCTVIIVLILGISGLGGDESYTSYTVQKGDTLYRIAKKFNISVADLQACNKISDPSRLKVGDTIKIPVKDATPGAETFTYTYYTVKKGDTLYSIARQFKIPLDTLLKTNSLKESSVLKIGAVLKIPLASVASASTSSISASSETTSPGGVENTKGIPFWPHAGKISYLSGKLSQAVEFSGTEGDKVYAVATGKVTWAGTFRGYGKMVFVKSAGGFVYVYGGLNELSVQVGETVHSKTILGTLGVNPHDKQAKVFFCVSKDGQPYDPAKAPRT